MTHEEHDIVDRVFVHKDAEIARLKSFLARAADALKKESWPSAHHDYSSLIAELRKAAAE